LKDILDNGASFPLRKLNDKDRDLDNSYHIDRGNHKSLSKYAFFIDPVITEDVERGFALPLPVDVISKLKNISVAPLGCHKQNTMNENS